MKRLIGILIVSIALLCVVSVSAADYPAETAEPSEAVVTVDGNPVDFCAYNLYGSNYFMLRDVAAALSGTDKQFNVDWVNNAVSLTSETEYEWIGTEFSQNADSSADALFFVPVVTLDGTEITLVGYNINGSNYFKIRDIARIFDFNIGYEYGHILIDTAEQYAPEVPYDGADTIGMAHEADLALFINEMPIVSYYTAVDTAYNETQLARVNENPRLNGVYVDAKNLENYGFDVAVYEDAIWLTRNKDKKFGMLDGEIINSAPTGISEVYASDTKVYLDGVNTRNIKINSEPYISAAELLKYGVISENNDASMAQLKFDNRINIDFLEKDLRVQLGEDVERISVWYGETNKESTEVYNPLNKGEVLVNANEGIELAEGTSDLNDYTDIFYIGAYANGEKNGIGIYRIDSGGWSVFDHGYFEYGEFVDGGLYDGVSYTQQYAGTAAVRTEGARVKGYKREFVLPYFDKKPSENLRFGYRAVREGAIENGEYVGYYREYDEDGKLIFEGDYNDWVKQKG